MAASEVLAALSQLLEAVDSLLAGCEVHVGRNPEEDDTYTHERSDERELTRVRDLARAAVAKAEAA
jgi:hypothetical protein